VVPQLLNKGVIVKSFMNRLLKKRAGRLPVFALIIGDEQCDDMMFEVRMWCGIVLWVALYPLGWNFLVLHSHSLLLLLLFLLPSSPIIHPTGYVPNDWRDVT
jgi:Trehalose-phosphatase